MREIPRPPATTILRAGACLVAAALLCGGAVAGANGDTGRDGTVRKHVEKEVDARGRTVSIEAAVSSLTVAAGSGDRVRVTADLEFWSNVERLRQRVDEEFEVEITESADTIGISVTLPGLEDRKARKTKVHYEIELAVTVPRSTSLEIENRYGEVRVEGVGGPARIVNTSGSIFLEEASGEVELEGRYGGIRVRDVDGDLRADTNSGNIDVQRVTGMAELNVRYGNIDVREVGSLDAKGNSGVVTAEGIKGDARISNAYANVEVASVAGRLDVTNKSGAISAREIGRDAVLSASYGPVEVAGVEGDLKVVASSGSSRVSDVAGGLNLEGSYADAVVERVGGAAEISVTSGGVTATALGGDLSVRCSFGTVRASDVRGALRVEASSTGVEAKRIGRSVDVETSYAGVDISGAGGAVNVRNESGAVRVRGLSDAALRGNHAVETSYADIEFVWPERQGLSYRLESTYGRIDCSFPGTVSERGSHFTLEGSTGNGEASVSLQAKSGSVRLRSD